MIAAFVNPSSRRVSICLSPDTRSRREDRSVFVDGAKLAEPSPAFVSYNDGPSPSVDSTSHGIFVVIPRADESFADRGFRISLEMRNFLVDNGDMCLVHDAVGRGNEDDLARVDGSSYPCRRFNDDSVAIFSALSLPMIGDRLACA